MQNYSSVQNHEGALQMLQDKIEALENRSRRNNLRIIGVPESMKPEALIHLCSMAIPAALGINSQCTVERAHRIGPPAENHKNPDQ